MRVILAGIGTVLLLGGCEPEPPQVEAAAARSPVEIDYPVPQDSGAQTVKVITRDVPGGAEIPWHTHAGIEIAYLESGEMELSVSGEANRRFGPGDAVMVPRGAVHSARNTGETPARLVLTYVIDAGEPLRTPADAPTD